MGGLTSAVDWWEEWQLRVLVLSSLAIQFFLFFFPYLRRQALSGWVKFIMWLAYIGGDAVAIYALATLFNRHKAAGEDGGGGRSSSSMLEVVWGPILLLHLGGHDGITAYNIEDNELWSRHLLTAVSQVTVAIYVFSETWPPGGDKRLLQAAILLFVPGVLKCFHKPWALKSASIYNLVSSPAAVKQKEGDMKAEGYVEEVIKYFVRQQQMEEGEAQGAMEDEGRRPSLHDMAEPAGTGTAETLQVQNETSMLFVDLSSPYYRRFSILKDFCRLTEKRAYGSVRQGLAGAFLLLYTKAKTVNMEDSGEEADIWTRLKSFFISPTQVSRGILPWAAIGLFQHSHRGAYNDIDVKITYVILCCTAALEFCSIGSFSEDHQLTPTGVAREMWPEMVAQRSFIGGYVARSNKTEIVSRLLGCCCKYFLDQQHYWRKRPCFSSRTITGLVRQYLKDGWEQKVQDAASYRRFNDNRGHWALEGNKKLLGWSIKGPFDESVLRWHIATDLCFFLSPSSSHHICDFDKRWPGMWSNDCGEELTDCKSVLCRQMSNYMAYLLLVNPEMLLPSSRRNLFTTAQEELEAIFKDNGEKPPPGLDKRALAQKITSKLQSSPPETFIHEAWKLAQDLRKLDDEKKMWKVIQGVWVEMLCYSTGRCRGYLHAKALGKGGEFLSYVWLLMFYMGMETFTDKLQREELSSHEVAGTGNNATTAPPSTFERVSSSTSAGAAPSTVEIFIAE